MTADRPVLLLDGASMWFRSFFGVPSSITAPDGRPVNALRGFLDAISTLVTQHRPSRLVVCLDLDWRPQWRVDRIPSYKAHRVEEPRPDGLPDVEEVPDELTPQVDMIMAILDAFGIATAGAPGFEADDVLGTVRVFYIGRGLSKAVLFGPTEVADTYGVPVDRAGPAYAELALLRGDPSDGLPGVAGIGEKTAATLMAQHGSLAAIVAAAADPSSKMPAAQRKKLLAAEEYIIAAEPVVRVASDAPVTLSRPDDVLPLSAADPARVVALAEEYGVLSSIGRLQKALDKLP
ncbi:MAG: 5-3 exonuclease [Mycobacterium sp.]|nr:5-3 exonuclease [Mycobacterium sp.]